MQTSDFCGFLLKVITSIFQVWKLKLIIPLRLLYVKLAGRISSVSCDHLSFGNDVIQFLKIVSFSSPLYLSLSLLFSRMWVNTIKDYFYFMRILNWTGNCFICWIVCIRDINPLLDFDLYLYALTCYAKITNIRLSVDTEKWINVLSESRIW